VLTLLGCVWVVQHTINRLVFQAMLTDAISWGIATGVVRVVRAALSPRTAARCLAYGLAVVAMFILVNSVPKWNLTCGRRRR
jgi:hypothetical protein